MKAPADKPVLYRLPGRYQEMYRIQPPRCTLPHPTAYDAMEERDKSSYEVSDHERPQVVGTGFTYAN
jgi:hypothetical protein